jgi:FtsP/CotA-like multicopper oxidase with cupredoxin domain
MASWQEKLALIAQRNRREIIEAKLSRRNMVKLGLLTAAGTLVLKRGLSARADGGGGQPASPPTKPFVTPLPLPVKKLPTTTLNPAPQLHANIANGEAPRADFQAFGSGPNQYLPLQFFEIHAREVQHIFDPALPSNTVWGYDGLFPGPVINAQYGAPTIVRFHNDLPANHVGFGIPQITTHLHNAHVGSESDGYPQDFYNSGQFKDHFFPNQFAGFTTPGLKQGLNGSTIADGDPNEALSFLWYHDHRVAFTAQNVYKGLAGFFTLFDDVDTGDENDLRFSALRLPSNNPNDTTGTDTAHAFDVSLGFTDKVFDAEGQQFFDLFNTDGILGDKFLVNGVIQPFFNVARRKYRFRLLNIGPSRFYQFFLSNDQSFLQISNDGNLLPHPIPRTSIQLGPAERADIIVDFTNTFLGDQIFLQNRLEQVDGRGPTGKLINPGTSILKFIVDRDANDPSQVPANLRPLPVVNLKDVKQTRNWEFQRGNGAWQINGQFFDPNVVRAAPLLGSAEIWTLKNGGGGWSHPIHIHQEEFQILTRNGKPPPIDEVARKDVVRLGPGEEVTTFRRFRDFTGQYPMHCHNVVHEDHAMMLRWDIVTGKTV